MTCSQIILQTRSVTGGNFSCKRQLETLLRCKLEEKIALCDSAFSQKAFLGFKTYIYIETLKFYFHCNYICLSFKSVLLLKSVLINLFLDKMFFTYCQSFACT